MKLKMIINKQMGVVTLEKDKEYKVTEIVQDCYKVKVPMKRKGRFWNVLVQDDEGELLDE
jgi:hypothetical protein